MVMTLGGSSGDSRMAPLDAALDTPPPRWLPFRYNDWTLGLTLKVNMSGILGQRADKDVSTSLTVTVLLFPLGLPCKYFH